VRGRYSWRQFEEDCKVLTKKIKRSKFQPKTIVALARGGLTLGVKLSHSLHTPLMIVSAKTYNGEKQSLNTVLLNSSYTVPLQSPILILDEIADSGKTLAVVMDHFKSLGVIVKTATILYKKHSVTKPDYYIKEVENEKWIEFPWEA